MANVLSCTVAILACIELARSICAVSNCSYWANSFPELFQQLIDDVVNVQAVLQSFQSHMSEHNYGDRSSNESLQGISVTIQLLEVELMVIHCGLQYQQLDPKATASRVPDCIDSSCLIASAEGLKNLSLKLTRFM
jgi:hypothetical protein